MRAIIRLTIVMMSAYLMPTSLAHAETSSCPAVLDSTQRLLNSMDKVNLCEQYQGQTLLVVNTASQCGFTSQFEQLEALHQEYKDQGLTVIGFPSNDFNQDRGSEQTTANVCYLDYGVTFPMMARSSLFGEEANPVFQYIRESSGMNPRWNFYKFLISKEGAVVAAFPSSTSPSSSALKKAIEAQL